MSRGSEMFVDARRSSTVTRHLTLLLCATLALGNATPATAQECTQWTLRATDGPTARMAHAVVYDSARGVTVLFGGWHWVPSHLEDLGDTWEWDGNTWTQRATDGPSPRHDHAMAYDSARGVTVLYGGRLGEAKHGSGTGTRGRYARRGYPSHGMTTPWLTTQHAA